MARDEKMMISGWLLPDRTYIECKMYHHLQALVDALDLDWLNGFAEQIEEATRECVALERRDGRAHAEWHTVDMLEGSLMRDAYDSLLDLGYVRVGTMGRIIHFEGRPKTLAERKTELEDFAGNRDYDWRFEPAKP